MGNCQAIDAAALVLQHPSGRVEKLYWPVTAGEVMRTNPGHYVALVITLLPREEEKPENAAVGGAGGVRVTRVKLLKPSEILVVGQAYRLITSQDVMKGLWAKKYARMKKESESTQRTKWVKQNPVETQDRHQHKTAPSSSTRSRPWRPSLQSISEADFHTNLNKQHSL